MGRFDQSVDGVWHPAIGDDDPSTAIDFLRQTACEALIMTHVMENVATSIATGDEMVDGTWLG